MYVLVRGPHVPPKEIPYQYSSPPLTRPLYLPRNCGHIREVSFGERENYKCIHGSSARKLRTTLGRVVSVESPQ